MPKMNINSDVAFWDIPDVEVVAKLKITGQTFTAVENVVAEMIKIEGVHQITHGNIDFVVNERLRTAVVLAYVVKDSNREFVKKHGTKSTNNYDIAKRITTVDVVRREAMWFLFNEKYVDYSLAITTGSNVHESCVFLRRINEKYHAIYFNPNYSIKTHGVQYSESSVKFMKSFGKSYEKIESFHAPCHNLSGKCTYQSWQAIYKFIVDGFSPFENTQIKLADSFHDTILVRFVSEKL